MVHSYLRFCHSHQFGQLASPTANLLAFKPKDTKILQVITAAAEYLQCWDVRSGECTSRWTAFPDSSTLLAHTARQAAMSAVTRIEKFEEILAVGYEDGTIRLFNLAVQPPALKCTFQGHSRSILSLRFNESGGRLFSGSLDTNIIVWDLTAERGLFRLRGHTGPVTDLLPIGNDLLSCSLDGAVRVWTVEEQFCKQILPHPQPIWAIAMDSKKKFLAVGGAEEQKIHIYRVSEEPEKSSDFLLPYGEMPRQSRKRIISLQFINNQQVDTGDHQEFLIVHAADRFLELFHIKKSSRKRKKLAAAAAAAGAGEEAAAAVISSPSEYFHPLTPVHFGRKIVSFAVMPLKRKKSPQELFEMFFSYSDNTLGEYLFQYPIPSATTEASGASQASILKSVGESSFLGHRTPIRVLSLSSDNSLLLSASNEEFRIWDILTGNCIRAIECGPALVGFFLPGNRHILLGTQTGLLELYDIHSTECLQRIQGHQQAIYCLDLKGNQREFITGSSDKQLKIWEFQLKEIEIPIDSSSSSTDHIPSSSSSSSTMKRYSKQLEIVLLRELTLTDSIMAVRYSPDGKYIAIGLLDSTIRIFHEDSLQFHLALYGHKLPILSISISSDNSLILTGSADKNIKIWGMEFGDCHRSLFAHQDSITACGFVKGTHMAFTVGKDRVVKYWDCDNFQEIQELTGHTGELWALAVSGDGSFVVSAGSDRMIRVWKQTETQLFLEEEKELALEAQHERATLTAGEQQIGNIEGANLEKPSESAIVPKTAASEETMKAAERFIEGIELAKNEHARLTEKPDSQANPLLFGHSPMNYIYNLLESIPSAQLDSTLLQLTYSETIEVLKFFRLLLKNSSTVQGKSAREAAKSSYSARIELLGNSILFLLSVHLQQFQTTATGEIHTLLRELRDLLRNSLEMQKTMIGINMAGGKFLLKRKLEEKERF